MIKDDLIKICEFFFPPFAIIKSFQPHKLFYLAINKVNISTYFNDRRQLLNWHMWHFYPYSFWISIICFYFYRSLNCLFFSLFLWKIFSSSFLWALIIFIGNHKNRFQLFGRGIFRGIGYKNLLKIAIIFNWHLRWFGWWFKRMIRLFH